MGIRNGSTGSRMTNYYDKSRPRGFLFKNEKEYLKERDRFLNEHGNGWWVNYCIDKKNKRTRVTKIRK